MSNKSKKNIIQVSTFLRGAIQGPVWAEAVLKQLFNAIGDVVTLGQSRPPVGELLPFDGIGSHDVWIKSKTCGHGTIR